MDTDTSVFSLFFFTAYKHMPQGAAVALTNAEPPKEAAPMATGISTVPDSTRELASSSSSAK